MAYAVMPYADYQDACEAVREKTGGTEVIKSGDMGALIRAISGGGDAGEWTAVAVGDSLTITSFSDLSGYMYISNATDDGYPQCLYKVFKFEDGASEASWADYSGSLSEENYTHMIIDGTGDFITIEVVFDVAGYILPIYKLPY